MHYALWPILLIIGANVAYNVATKETPAGVNPFVSLIVTYLTAAGICTAVAFFQGDLRSLPSELGRINWTAPVLGAAIIGLETGYIFAFRSGWPVNIASVVANIALAVVLVFVGWLAYHEQLGLQKAAGIALCMAGLAFLAR